ncbi:MAG: TRAP transporter small permease subunit [Ottowia sp.]|uniref:TRAP transporter small permease subunit n=1 Tax=Ottowia sp. TaxID=1898956 RepID=UPI003C74452A
MRRLIIRLNRLFLIAGGLILLVMTIQIGVVALSRALFNLAFDGNVEIAKYYYMVAISALPLGAVQAAREHVIVEVFTQWMSERAKMLLDWCALIFTTVYSAVLTVGCVLAAMDAFETREFHRLFAFDLIYWPSRWILAVGLLGFLMTAIYMVFSRQEKLESDSEEA